MSHFEIGEKRISQHLSFFLSEIEDKFRVADYQKLSGGTFEPRFSIEQAKAGQYFGKPYFSDSGAGLAMPLRARTASGLYPHYTVVCPYSQKRFKALQL